MGPCLVQRPDSNSAEGRWIERQHNINEWTQNLLIRKVDALNDWQQVMDELCDMMDVAWHLDTQHDRGDNRRKWIEMFVTSLRSNLNNDLLWGKLHVPCVSDPVKFVAERLPRCVEDPDDPESGGSLILRAVVRMEKLLAEWKEETRQWNEMSYTDQHRLYTEWAIAVDQLAYAANVAIRSCRKTSKLESKVQNMTILNGLLAAALKKCPLPGAQERFLDQLDYNHTNWDPKDQQSHTLSSRCAKLFYSEFARSFELYVQVYVLLNRTNRQMFPILHKGKPPEEIAKMVTEKQDEYRNSLVDAAQSLYTTLMTYPACKNQEDGQIILSIVREMMNGTHDAELRREVQRKIKSVHEEAMVSFTKSKLPVKVPGSSTEFGHKATLLNP